MDDTSEMQMHNTDTIKRKPAEYDSEFTRYWSTHQPLKSELAKLLKISVRRVDQLYQEGVLRRGAPLPELVRQWVEYQVTVKREARGGRAGRG